MRLFDIPSVRPILAASINLLLIAIGLAAAAFLPVREFPDVAAPVVTVNTLYLGAQAEIVEREVTRAIEDNLNGVAGIRQIRSSSRDEVSDIDLEFEAGTDIDAAAADVRDKVSAVRSELPEGVEEPVIEKVSADDQPMMYITMQSDELDTAALSDLADRYATDTLGSVSGVAQVQIGGEKRYAMRIWLDRRAMAARGIAPADIAGRIQAENVELPAGEIETRNQIITLRADTRFTSAQQFAELAVLDDKGARVRLGDVAHVEVGVEDEKTRARVDGKDTVSLGVIRQANANTLAVASAVVERLDALRAQLPASVRVDVAYNEARFIQENLKNIAWTLVQTVAIIVAVIFIFLGSIKTTLIPAATIPASIIPAAAVAALLGFSLNSLTILAVILAISLCTDDAVVIMENIRRRQGKGEPLLLASVRATRQIGFAVFASALSLIAVVLPLAFLEGNAGRLFREFAVILAAIIAFSTVAALTLGPMLSTLLFGEVDEPGRLQEWVNRGLEKTSRGYRRVLDRAVDHITVTVLLALAFVGAGVFAFSQVPAELAPDEDRAAVRIRVEGPEGVSSAYMAAKAEEIEKAVRDVSASFQKNADGSAESPVEAGQAARSQSAGGAEAGSDEKGPEPVASVLSIVAPGRAGQGESNVAFIIVRLADWGERDITQFEFLEALQKRLGSIAGVSAFANNPSSLGQAGGGRPVQMLLKGSDRAELSAWAERIVAEGGEMPGLVALDSDYADTKPQVSLTVDRSRAAALGVTAQAVGETLGVMFGEGETTRYVDRGEEYDVILRARAEDRATLSDIENIFVRAEAGELVPLSSLVRLEERGAVRELERLDRQPAITLGANLGQSLALGDALSRLEEIAAREQPGGTEIGYAGQSLDFQESGIAVVVMFGVILVLVYFLLAGQFESFAHPFIILISAPAAVAGGFLMLWCFGFTLNIYSQIALVLLVGLVAKNAILIVEFANQLREGGAEVREATLEAASQRLRPILMTTLATVLGAVPLVLESGAGAEARTTVGAVVTAGTLFGTLISLFVVPALYVAIGSRTGERIDLAQKLEELDRDHPEGDSEPQQGEVRERGRPDPSIAEKASPRRPQAAE